MKTTTEYFENGELVRRVIVEQDGRCEHGGPVPPSYDYWRLLSRPGGFVPYAAGGTVKPNTEIYTTNVVT